MSLKDIVSSGILIVAIGFTRNKIHWWYLYRL